MPPEQEVTIRSKGPVSYAAINAREPALSYVAEDYFGLNVFYSWYSPYPGYDGTLLKDASGRCSCNVSICPFPCYYQYYILKAGSDKGVSQNHLHQPLL
jgi:hypothetical protein